MGGFAIKFSPIDDLAPKDGVTVPSCKTARDGQIRVVTSPATQKSFNG